MLVERFCIRSPLTQNIALDRVQWRSFTVKV